MRKIGKGKTDQAIKSRIVARSNCQTVGNKAGYHFNAGAEKSFINRLDIIFINFRRYGRINWMGNHIMMNITLRQYIRELHKIAKENPKALDHPMIYSCDSEGNYFEPVHYGPAPVFFDGDQIDMSGEKEINAICIN